MPKSKEKKDDRMIAEYFKHLNIYEQKYGKKNNSSLAMRIFL